MTDYLKTTIELPGDGYEVIKYPAGELQVRLREKTQVEISKSDAIRVVARITDSQELMKLCLLTDAIQHDFTGKMELVLPYLPYSRADRRFVEGDCYGLKVFGRIINSLGYNPVLTLDAHSHKSKMNVSNLLEFSPSQFIFRVRRILGSPAVLLPDKGAKDRYDSNDVLTLACDKIRNPKTGELSGFAVPPKSAFGDKTSVLIVDDICDGGGTFLGIAEALREYDLYLYLYVTHGIFSQGLTKLLDKFLHIYSTNSFTSYSHPRLTRFDIKELM